MLSEDTLKLWDAWKQFPGWWNKFWKYQDWKGDISDTIWTNGVITPFIINVVAPHLKYHVTRERVILGKKRKDFTLYKGKEMLAYIEHENEINNVYDELPKLIRSKAKLKVIISYGTRGEIENSLKSLISAIDDSKRDNRFNEKWLFIFGIYESQTKYKYMEKQSDWIGHSIYWKKGHVRIERLEW